MNFFNLRHDIFMAQFDELCNKTYAFRNSPRFFDKNLVLIQDYDVAFQVRLDYVTLELYERLFGATYC